MTCFRSLSSVSFASRSVLPHHLRWLRLLFSALSHYYGLDRGSLLENESLDWRDGLSFRKSGPCRLSLIGRVTRWRVLNMLRLFHLVKGAGLKYIAPNKFVIKFNHALDREKALGGCPWVLDKRALLFESIEATKKPVDQQLTGMLIIARVLQLSLLNRPECIARLLRDKLGEFVEIPKDSDNYYSSYFCIKVLVDATKPLLCGLYFQHVEWDKLRLQVVYDRFPIFASCVEFLDMERLIARFAKWSIFCVCGLFFACWHYKKKAFNNTRCVLFKGGTFDNAHVML